MGLANELFKDGVIGSDLKDSLVMFLNQVKDKLTLPKLAYLANITSIYKGKNDKKDLDNDRGVFTLTVLRMILDKVIYLEEYETLDKNMSDSNAGARKDRNCRNHAFIVNGILHDKKNNKGPPIDVQIFDVAKCFDEVWPADTINVLYDLGIRNNNLCILHEGTKKSFISI